VPWALEGLTCALGPCLRRSCKNEPALRSGNWPSQLSCSFKPLLNHCLGICQGLAVRLTVRGATGKLRHFSYESLIFFAPVNDHFILRHRVRLRVCISPE